MDPLSSVLSLLKLRSYTSGGFDIGGDFSIEFKHYDGIKCYVLVSGECWLEVEGIPNPMRIVAGDCFMLFSGTKFRLASDLSLPPVDALSLFRPPLDGAIATINGGGTSFGLGGHFALSGDSSILLNGMPPVIHLSGQQERAAMRWSLEKMMEELRNPQPGGSLVVEHLAQMMLVQALRLHLAEAPRGGTGWFLALADQQISAAIAAIHSEPARRWTLQQLAERANMSRSAFAFRFKEIVGVSPMDYLTRWRMLVAADRLANSGDTISAISLSLGYESESAFSTAFKRVMGLSPRLYGQRRTTLGIPCGRESDSSQFPLVASAEEDKLAAPSPLIQKTLSTFRI
ncbi:AraC family transcriptional regulator [Silvibacterium acidisoli]|uniref:AraC family transcriptional regulator n=1 Tax=Acidobacteriaceae bacterium ZG23-2 TaxID=2883246 RepID=UPI00406C48E0